MSQAGISGNMGGGGRIVTAISTFNPNQVLNEFDDFISTSGGSLPQGKLEWSGVTTVASNTAGTANNPGIWMTDTVQAVASISLNGPPFVLGGGVLTISWIIRTPTLSGGGNTYVYSAGLADSTTLLAASKTFVDGVYFQYTDTVNGGNWQLKSTKASVTTTVNSASTVGTNFTTLSIVVNAGGTSVSYYVDNVQVGTAITTNIPTAGVTPFMQVFNTAGTNPTTEIDLFYINYVLATPRPGPTSSSTIVGTGMLIEQYRQTSISTNVLTTDAIIGVSSTAAPRTMTMPNTGLVTGQRWTIKDESGGAGANAITINGNGINVDAAGTYPINVNYGAVDIYYNGTQFYII